MDIIKQALKDGLTTLSEFDSKKVLTEYKIPVTQEIVVKDTNELQQAAEKIGFPMVLKGSSAEIAHKTEAGLIKIDIRNLDEATAAFEEIISKMGSDKGGVLVQEMVKGQRELVVGLTRDPQFGPCVMFGLGGIFTEILKDVAFRVAPLTKKDAMDIMDDIKSKKILDAVRGIQEIDINPLKIRDGKPIAVDALVVLKQ